MSLLRPHGHEPLAGFDFLKAESQLMGIAAVVGGVLLMGIIHTYLVPLMRSDA